MANPIAASLVAQIDARGEAYGDGANVTVMHMTYDSTDAADDPTISSLATGSCSFDDDGIDGEEAYLLEDGPFEWNDFASLAEDSYSVCYVVQHSSSENFDAAIAWGGLSDAEGGDIDSHQHYRWGSPAYLYQNYRTIDGTAENTTSGTSVGLTSGDKSVVVITYDSSTGQRLIYIDGSAGTTITGLTQPDADDFEFVCIGGRIINVYSTPTLYAENPHMLLQMVMLYDKALTPTEIGYLTSYVDTYDATPAGSITQYLRLHDCPTGSRAQVYNIPHGASGSVDVTECVLADIGGQSFVLTVQNASGTTGYKFWFDYNSTSSAPAAGTYTLVEVDIATTDDSDDLADSIATAAAALTDLGAYSSGSVVVWTNDRNGEVAEPSNLDVTGAIVAEARKGGTDTDLVVEASSTSGNPAQLAYEFDGRPFAVSIGIAHAGYALIWGEYTLGRYGTDLDVAPLLRKDFAYTAPAAHGYGTDWSFVAATRALTVSTEMAPDSLYDRYKYWALNATTGLQEDPLVGYVGFADIVLNAATFAAGSVVNLIDDGVTILDSSDAITDRYVGFVTSAIPSAVQPYIVQEIDGTPSDAASTGTINELIQVEGGASDYLYHAEAFARTWGYAFGARSTRDDGIESLDATGYQLALPAIAADANNETARATVATWTDVTLTPGHSTDATYDWAGAIDGGGRTSEQVYERCKYLTDEDQTATLDGTAGRVFRGLGELYLQYTGAGGFTEGLIVTGGTSGASARIVADHGDALTLRRTDDDHSLEFTATETITDTSTGTATAGTPDPYALPSGAPVCWFEGDDLVFARGWWAENLSGSVKLTAADGTAYSPPVSVTVAVTNVVVGSVVHLKRVDTQSVLIDETAASSTVQTTFAYSGSPVAVEGSVRKSTTSPKYIPFDLGGQIEAGGYSAFVNQSPDTVSAAT